MILTVGKQALGIVGVVVSRPSSLIVELIPRGGRDLLHQGRGEGREVEVRPEEALRSELGRDQRVLSLAEVQGAGLQRPRPAEG